MRFFVCATELKIKKKKRKKERKKERNNCHDFVPLFQTEWKNVLSKYVSVERPADWFNTNQSNEIQSTGTCVLIGSYFSCRGSQSNPGRSCLAVCLTSSLSTNRLWRCSACTTATRIHSMRGGRSRNGLQEEITVFIWLVLEAACFWICWIKS